MAREKKALLVDVDLKVRVIVDESLDPDTDIEEFDKTVEKAIKERMKEEGISFVGEGISNFQNDAENPYDPEYDE